MEFTVRDVAEAMIADPTPKTIGTYETADGAYCAVGGASKLLTGSSTSLGTALSNVKRDGVKPVPPEAIDYQGDARADIRADLESFRREPDVQRDLFMVITTMNDYTSASKADIGKKILNEADEDTLSTVVYGPQLFA